MTLRAAALTTFATTLSLAGCFGELPADGVGSAVAEVQSIPAGVGCLRVVFRAPGATNDTTRNLGVTPGNPATLDLGYLAAGAYSFRASAYNVACGSVVAATVPTWVGDPAAATITPGLVTTVPITLRPNVMTRTTVDFVQPVRAIYAGSGSSTTYAVMMDGTVRGWGRNDFGQIGDGTTASGPQPRVVVGLTQPMQIDASRTFACATADGLYCWGQFGGRLADDGPGQSLVPRNNPDVEPSRIAVNETRICGGFNDHVTCWHSPETLNGSAVNAFTFALGEDWFWGASSLFVVTPYAALMRSTTTDPGPSAVTLRSRVSAVSVAVTSYCALGPGGAVLCGGSSAIGAGPLDEAPYDAPADTGIRSATALVSGAAHHCALREDRTVMCWGGNAMGAVGAGLDEGLVRTPVTVPLRDVVQVAAGAGHTCALIADGSVWCWGLNDYGQLGDGTRIPRFTPVRVRF